MEAKQEHTVDRAFHILDFTSKLLALPRLVRANAQRLKFIISRHVYVKSHFPERHSGGALLEQVKDRS